MITAHTAGKLPPELQFSSRTIRSCTKTAVTILAALKMLNYNSTQIVLISGFSGFYSQDFFLPVKFNNNLETE